ncbi:unnamed protein product [Closterium sp. Naga37s-1]|nr:unnamed protein product [Closterium sp. Naga37s-1]
MDIKLQVLGAELGDTRRKLEATERRGIAEVIELRGEVEEWRRKIGELDSAVCVVEERAMELALVKGELAEVEGGLAAVKGELGTVNGELAAVKGELGTVKGELVAVHGELAVVKRELAEHSDRTRILCMHLEETRHEVKEEERSRSTDMRVLRGMLEEAERMRAVVKGGLVAVNGELAVVKGELAEHSDRTRILLEYRELSGRVEVRERELEASCG